MIITNLINEKNGRSVANQFVIIDSNTTIFQSYNSKICEIHNGSAFIRFYKDFEYSKTTMKHLCSFLRQYLNIDELNMQDVRCWIKTGKANNINLYNSVWDVQFIDE